jgi:hypothetical protein
LAGQTICNLNDENIQSIVPSYFPNRFCQDPVLLEASYKLNYGVKKQIKCVIVTFMVFSWRHSEAEW